MPNKPHRHHYIPEFYTKRWADEKTGQLLVFSKPHDKVIDRRKHPAATGYMDQLYRLRNFPEELEQQVEENFFKPVDNAAHDALCILETVGPRGFDARPALRTAWSRFMLSLLLRCPEDVNELRKYWKEDFVRPDAITEAKYQAIREDNNPLTMHEFLSDQPPQLYERHLFHALLRLIDNANVGSVLNVMSWAVVDTSKARYPLLTSDRPIVYRPLKMRQGHVALPIGPKRLFVATSEHSFMRELMQTPISVLVETANKQVVEQSQSFVYASDTGQSRFIRDRFALHPQPRLIVDILRQHATET